MAEWEGGFSGRCGDYSGKERELRKIRVAAKTPPKHVSSSSENPPKKGSLIEGHSEPSKPVDTTGCWEIVIGREKAPALFALAVFELCGFAFNPRDVKLLMGPSLGYFSTIDIKGAVCNSKKAAGTLEKWLHQTYPEKSFECFVDEHELKDGRSTFDRIRIWGGTSEIGDEIHRAIDKYDALCNPPSSSLRDRIAHKAIRILCLD
jgi:hypothetical protein